MCDADVARTQRAPRAIGFADARGQLGLEIAKVAGGRNHIGVRVEPIGRRRVSLRCLQSITVCATFARGGRWRIAVFLIGHGANTAPFDAGGLLHALKQRPIARQHGLDAILEDAASKRGTCEYEK